jgi:hypothetical protein
MNNTVTDNRAGPLPSLCHFDVSRPIELANAAQAAVLSSQVTIKMDGGTASAGSKNCAIRYFPERDLATRLANREKLCWSIMSIIMSKSLRAPRVERARGAVRRGRPVPPSPVSPSIEEVVDRYQLCRLVGWRVDVTMQISPSKFAGLTTMKSPISNNQFQRSRKIRESRMSITRQAAAAAIQGSNGIVSGETPKRDRCRHRNATTTTNTE